MTKPNKEAKELAKQLSEAGFSANILLDKDGNPVASHGWYKDIIISKIDLTKSEGSKH